MSKTDKLDNLSRRGEEMARRCDLCGKGVMTGNNVSHAQNKTKRVWKPNLLKMRTIIDGKIMTVKICTSCLKRGFLTKA